MPNNILGYSEEWFKFGFIDDEGFKEQVQMFKISEDKCTEHYRYRTFQKIIDSKSQFSDDDIKNLIHLIKIDEDQAMSSSILSALFDSKKLTELQFGVVRQELLKYGNWAEMKVQKHDMGIRIREDPNSVSLF